jgi:hypothetical protein
MPDVYYGTAEDALKVLEDFVDHPANSTQRVIFDWSQAAQIWDEIERLRTEIQKLKE